MGDFFNDQRQLGCMTLTMALVLMLMSGTESSFAIRPTHDWAIRKGRLEQSSVVSVIVNPRGIVTDGPNKGKVFASQPAELTSNWLVTPGSVVCAQTSCSDGSKILSVRMTQSVSLLWAINALTGLSASLLLGTQPKRNRNRARNSTVNLYSDS